MAVMTTRFVSAAELMGRVLGFPGYGFATIPHPISSATDDGLRDAAVAAAVQARHLLLGGDQSAQVVRRTTRHAPHESPTMPQSW
jgi:hypothetical protein